MIFRVDIIIIIIINPRKLFIPEFLMFFFSMSLGYSKSSQASRTLFSILANLNKALVYMGSTRPLISNSSSILPSLTGLFRGPHIQLISAPLLCSISVLVHWKSLSFYPFVFFDFLPVVRWVGKVTLFGKCFVCVCVCVFVCIKYH